MLPKHMVPKLLAWFESEARDLPWRRTHDPYGVWVSEIMLQQTQVKTVIAFWNRWMDRLPNIAALAQADSDVVHKLWEGLGYYTRVRNLQRAAQKIMTVHGGQFPEQYEQVLDLPGIGPYTAGAICSIAFNQPRPILDGNVVRVLCRYYAITKDPRQRQVNDQLWTIAEALVFQAARLEQKRIKSGKRSKTLSTGFCSSLNQSLMELGALVCTPRQPKCEICPVRKSCQGRLLGIQHKLPSLPRRAAPTRRRFVAFVARHRGKLLLRQRPAGVVNAHLWEFPNIEVATDDGDPLQASHRLFGTKLPHPTHLRTIQHSITRYRIRLDVYQVTTESLAGQRWAPNRWINETEAHHLAFASAHKKILADLSGAGRVSESRNGALAERVKSVDKAGLGD